MLELKLVLYVGIFMRLINMCFSGNSITRSNSILSLLTAIMLVSTTANADFTPDIFDSTTAGNTLLFEEDFNGLAAGTVPAGWATTLAPDGWEISNATINNTACGSCNGILPILDGGFIYHDDTAGNEPVLTSPLIDLTTATDPYFTFNVHSYRLAGAEGNAGLANTNKSTLQINVLDSTGVSLGTVFEIGDTDINNLDGWLDKTVRLADFVGQQIQLQFVFINGNGTSFHDIALDNLEIVDVPAPGANPLLQTRGIQFYVPIPPSDITIAHTHLRDNSVCTGSIGAQDTVTELTSLTVGQTAVDDMGNPISALIHYDHIEDGLDSPSRRNQVTTEIWGDADPSNGFPPGYPGDEIFQGDVIILENVSDPGVAQESTGPAEPGDQIVGFTSTQNFELNYSAGDRIRSDSGLVMTRAGWNDGSSTLLAGASEVADTTAIGSSYLMPIGEDLSPAPVPDSFEYVGASIMAIANNTTKCG